MLFGALGGGSQTRDAHSYAKACDSHCFATLSKRLWSADRREAHQLTSDACEKSIVQFDCCPVEVERRSFSGVEVERPSLSAQLRSSNPGCFQNGAADLLVTRI